MYPPKPNEMNKDNSGCPEPSAPLQSSQFEFPPTAIGVPMNSTNQYNHSNNDNATQRIRSQSPVAWSTGLCDCCDDCNSCCLTCWCPCVAFGRIAEIVDRGSTSCGVSGALYTMIMCLTGCQCLYSCFYRSKLRGQYFLEESPCVDCCIHCWCEECSLCQEYRELKNQGFDMSIGWHGNMERQNRLRASGTASMIQGEMNR